MILVIAKYQERVDWATDYNKCVIEKGTDMPNIGREVSSFLGFICKNYDNLIDDEYVFCQGDPFDHCPNFLEEIKTGNYYGRVVECLPDGCPHHCGLDIDSFAMGIGVGTRERYNFKAGGQFKLTKAEILQRRKDWYEIAFHLSMTKPQAPWIFERLWPLIFPTLK